MIEFWAMIGLACLDHVFLNQLREHPDHVEETIREYGFRLSRWEMGEFKRLITIPGLLDQMHKICETSWENAFDPADRAPCWWSAERSANHDMPGDPPYVHPLRTGLPLPTGDDGRKQQGY